jgi:glycosyltransferase involved in cell wall biosynthesis
MFLNALESIRDQTYKNWRLVFIDDGSTNKGRPIVEEVLKDYLDQIEFIYIEDSIEQKETQGGSRHGLFMTEAIRSSTEDVFICLCDDDALLPDYLENLNKFYTDNPNINYSYSHIIPFDPYIETYRELVDNNITRGHGLNHTHNLIPSCTVDSTQVSYRINAFNDNQLHYPQGTRNLDASIYDQLYNSLGLCPFNSITSQYKAFFSDQLGGRTNTYNVVDKQ